jgi:acyl carrier protein
VTETTEKVIIDIITKYLEGEGQKITADTSLKNLGVDSLLMVEIIYDLEEHFDISIPDPELIEGQNRQFERVTDVVNVVNELIEEQHKNP